MVVLTTRQLAILRVLQESKNNGYMIRKELIKHDEKLSFGSLYPSLSKLEKLGFVKYVWEKNGDKEKKVYEITAKGVGAYEDALTYILLNKTGLGLA